MAIANYNAIIALTGSYAIRFTTSETFRDRYGFSAAEGTLLNSHPAGMFSDAGVYWIERFRVNQSEATRFDDDAAEYSYLQCGFHRGGSSVSQSAFLPSLASDYSWIVIDETNERYVIFPIDVTTFIGHEFVNYDVLPSFIADASPPAGAVAAVAESWAAHDGAETFRGSLDDAGTEVVVALIPNNTFRPTFGGTARAAGASIAGGASAVTAGATSVPPAARAAAASVAGGAASISAGATRVAAPIPVARGYVGRISQSPVAEALTDAGRLALDRAIPDPDDALAVAYDWERMPIEALRSQAAAWGFEPFTTLLGETYERQIMATFGQVCEYRNKWLVLDNFFDALEIIYAAEIVGLDGVRYAVDRQAGTWGGYDVTRARELWLLVTLPPAIPISNAEFIAYLAHAVRWLMPYFRHFVFLVLVNHPIEARPAAHPGVGLAAISYLEAVQA